MINVRQAMAAAWRRPVPDQLWDYLVEKGYVGEVEEDRMPVDDLVEEARQVLAAARSASPADDDDIVRQAAGAATAARIDALSAIYAAWARNDLEVQRFRRPGTSATPRPAALQGVLPRPQPLAPSSPRLGERDTPDQTRQPAAQVTGPPAIPASGQRDQAVPEAGPVDDAAVAAYRLSAQAGNPLSERKLAQMFGRTSRRWARARIADAQRIPSSGLTEDPAITVGAPSP